MIRVAILTVSDSCARGEREDLSGQTAADILTENGFEICNKKIVPDSREAITDELKNLSDNVGINVVVTCGGTGLGPRDVTPEVTASVCERMVPGLSEIIRAQGWKKTKSAVLSRASAGIRNKTLVINLPGSPRGVKESLEIILDVLTHAVEMMRGGGH